MNITLIEKPMGLVILSPSQVKACVKQRCYEYGSRTVADIIHNLGGRVPKSNPYYNAIQWRTP